MRVSTPVLISLPHLGQPSFQIEERKGGSLRKRSGSRFSASLSAEGCPSGRVSLQARGSGDRK
jgi:hypothetical protein